MRFIVYGSLRYQGCPVERVKAAAIEIGACLAARGHSVTVSSDNPTTVDRYVVQGISSVAGDHLVMVDRPENVLETDKEGSVVPNVRPFDETTLYPNVRFRFKIRTGSWIVTHFQATADADCVIVLGGGHGTASAGLSASALRKPVVAIKDFGGGAEDVWKEVSQYYKEAGIDDEKQNSLRQWGPKSALDTVMTGECLYRNNPLREKSGIALYVSLACLLLLVILWFTMFFGVFGSITGGRIALMLGICALLGSGLRTLVKLRTESLEGVAAVRVAIDSVSAVIVSLALMIFYFLGGIAYLGKPTFLNDTDPDKLRLSAFMVSLIGLGSGFLLDKALNKLEGALTPIIDPSLKGRG